MADDALEKNLDETHDRVHAEIKLVEERRAKLGALRQAGNAFPNDFRRDDLAQDLHREYGDYSNRNAGRDVTHCQRGRTHDIETRHGQGELRDDPGHERPYPALYCD